MNKAVFLDRDGVINRENGEYVSRPENFVVLPHAPKYIARLNKKGYRVIVITNQGGIAKGLYTHATLNEMHQHMLREVAATGGHIDAIYYCPHHPEISKCICRKPESQMIEKAMAKFQIDPLQSLFIGDKQRDIDAAAGAGVKGIIIQENEDWGFVLEDL